MLHGVKMRINSPNIEFVLRSKFLIFVLYIDSKQSGESGLPAGHPVPPAAQAGASKCPFLAAEMGQKNSSVVRQVSMEFQEDVQEVRTVQKGESHFRRSRSMQHEGERLYICFILSSQRCPPWPLPTADTQTRATI